MGFFWLEMFFLLIFEDGIIVYEIIFVRFFVVFLFVFVDIYCFFVDDGGGIYFFLVSGVVKSFGVFVGFCVEIFGWMVVVKIFF